MVAKGTPPAPVHLADELGAASREVRQFHDRLGAVLPILEPERHWHQRGRRALPSGRGWSGRRCYGGWRLGGSAVLMRPELIGLTILTVAVVMVGLLMLADRAGWRSPLPALYLRRRWLGLIYLFLILVTALQVLRIAGLL
jgi:hypothetical protein